MNRTNLIRIVVITMFVLITALVATGILIHQFKQRAAEQLRTINIELRDAWIADTVASLENGENTVFLYSCHNTDLLLERIAGMPGVQAIIFERTIDLSDKGLGILPSFPNLHSLEFRGERFLSDDNIRILTECKFLESLTISGSRITDKGLADIAEIPNLKTFQHSKHFSREATEKFLRTKPGIEIKYVNQ